MATTTKRIVNLELNRVEGDLELKIEYDGEFVTDAWCVGTMFRGFEQMLKGRAATDGLVITPRVCGICGTAHHYVAATALEHAWGCEVAPNGTRVRNVCLMAEELQSDLRHTFLMFAIDLCHPRYREVPGYERVVELFAPFEGTVYRETLRHTKEILKIVAVFGGQWPHGTYMVPGGVTVRPGLGDLVRVRGLLDGYQAWYERTILGCSLERWLENTTVADVEAWVDASPAHASSAMGVFFGFARRIGLTDLGPGHGDLLSFGNYHDPAVTRITDQPAMLRRAGFRDASTGAPEPFDHRLVAEHIKHSWYADDGRARHPWEGETLPEYVTGRAAYTWAKAPRYRGRVCEVGPLADLYHDGDALIRHLVDVEGSNAFARQFARLHRPARTLGLLRRTVGELFSDLGEPFLVPATPGDGEGVGMVGAARGGLAHWVQIEDERIARYQIITPTSWNASPRDDDGVPGHWERSLIGTRVADLDDPIELAHIVRSHDACLVCTVHVLDTDHRIRFSLV